MLPLPDSHRQESRTPTARLHSQPCSRTWVSSSGCHATVETFTPEGASLELRDLLTGQQTALSLQVVQQGKLEQAWVSDTGRAVLVQSSNNVRLRFHLWCWQDGNPDSSLPKQVIEVYHPMSSPNVLRRPHRCQFWLIVMHCCMLSSVRRPVDST